jgi:tetrahydromethanopterin S-methyltransferase subunit B
LVEKIPSWIERLLLPKLSEISGEIKALSTRIDSLEKTTNEKITSLDERINSLEKIFNERINSLERRVDSLEKMFDERITSLRNEMIIKFDSIEKRMPLIEKIMELEARLAKLEGKA